MYRPTVRYSEVYRDYVDQVFHATTLDRNQIVRLALFIAAHSEEYQAILADHLRSETSSLPSAKWRPDQAILWREQEPAIVEEDEDNSEEGDVFYAKFAGKADTRPVAIAGRGGSTGTVEAGTITRSPGPLREGVIRATGGLVFSID
ncbi:hypothetical protein [[Bacillus] enclensis]|uniref:hypothetical protein n=1 Tax=[Bacillus] enclensis TaxID=1402860 RepID=UPI0018DBB5B3|nr:hypothetical protein [[Bacillus] enclensis]MBH9965597.1 hypothetical protein [[Bacillus] enclensis]